MHIDNLYIKLLYDMNRKLANSGNQVMKIYTYYAEYFLNDQWKAELCQNKHRVADAVH